MNKQQILEVLSNIENNAQARNVEFIITHWTTFRRDLGRFSYILLMHDMVKTLARYSANGYEVQCAQLLRVYQELGKAKKSI